jgi:PAS domain S-box-containing protein
MNDDSGLSRWVLDTSTDGYWILDELGVTLYANPRMAEMLGRDVAAMAGFPVAAALDAAGQAQLDAHLADMTAGLPGAENVETQLFRADGTAIWGLVSWQPLHDDRGERIGWLHRVTEYTERKSLLERLRESEQQLATAQLIASIGSWEWDVGTDTVVWSDQLYRIYNLEPQEFAATYQGFLDFVHPEDRPLVRAAVESTFAGADEFTFDGRIVQNGGGVRWIRGLGMVVRGPDGLPVKMGGTAQDITDLVTSNELAAEANRRLELLQQMAMAANQASSLAEAIEFAALGLPAHTGWTPLCAFFLTDDANSTRTVPDAPAARGWATEPDPDLAQRARATGTMAFGPPVTHQDTHCVVAIPVLLGGRVICVLEVVADEVPPDENSRFLIDQIAGQLSLVAERERSAAQLAEARDQAMEASRLKGEFLATMSHEIRTPMNGVIGLNDLLLRTALDEHQRRLAEGLQSAGLTLLGIINDILDLSKIESGKLELETADFDVRAVFEQTAAVLGGPAHEKGLELVVACHPDVPLYLSGDAVRFGQVITNLGSNAVKFTDRGEVVVRATVEEETAERVLLRVDVTDTGVGIAPEDRERLFEAFTQVDPSTTRRHGGTGLGLAISRQLVHALGGELRVHSEIGEGSTFSFTAGFGRATSAPSRRSPGPRLLHGRRVLVVDDNETNRFILETQLTAWQLRPVSVASAAEALATLREAVRSQDPFEIALLDLVMPGMDGIELARRVAADPDLGDLTMLLLSSDQGIGSQQARAAGIRVALSKPVRHSELFDTLVGIVAADLDERHVVAPRTSPELGLRVLVVEDNYVNQLVATGLLEDFGCEVDVADDGADAVELLCGPHDYDAVLMDCRMPRLDGFDATRAVRAAETSGHRVPIIAMTASALEGERERCLAVGMDDFLTKPVDARDLEQALRRWTGAPTTTGPDSRRASDSPDPEAPTPHLDEPPADVLDHVRIRMLDELRKDGVSFFERTATSFTARVPDQVLAIRTAAAADDAAALVASAHQLKGSALNLGLPRVGATAARLETLGDTGTTAGSAGLVDALALEVERAVSALAEATARPR